MARSYPQRKNRNTSSGTFFGLPHAVMDCQNFVRLSSGATKLLLDLGRQYNGKNNGNLCAAYSVMRKRGWKSSGSLQNAKDELHHYGFIELTQIGGRNRPNLYALTWHPINEIKGKPDISETGVASRLWQETQPPFKKKPPCKNNFCTHHMSTGTHQAEQFHKIA